MPLTSPLLPIETKLERPMPRVRALLPRMAMPRPPDWEANPTSASGREVGREGRVHRHLGVGVDDAEAVGPDNPHAVGVGQSDDLALQAGPVGASLGEARCHHDEAADPPRRPQDVHHIEDLRGRVLR